MACYHPLVAYEHTFLKTENNKAVIKFQKPEQDEIYCGYWKTVELPCGTCDGCKLEHAKNWAIRCMLEAKLYKHNYFITLTYAEENVPTIAYTDISDKDNYQYCEELTLCKRDFQLFMKRLRKFYKKKYKWDNIRFFACGEYGDRTGRPHYHAIIFNLPINDLKPYFINELHQQIYQSETISNIWGLGLVTIGEVTYESAGYVARYTLKKRTKQETIDKQGEKEFTLMSRKPGIAQKYYTDNVEKIYKNDEIIISTSLDYVLKSKPPRYFDKLYDIDNEEDLYNKKQERRKKAQEKRDYQQKHTTNRPDELLKIAERKKQQSTKALNRQLKDI
ncbi:replication initiation protein [Alces alces faeces associated microvirus MP10 5560]|uniref:replication initiation protein n=1 Tax=Alces alces faeces associated microvirus MP10 5560 TaxID=2219133 RepID=UPI000DF0A7D3|nr:replication initiation protein [Alces alces faeces associated microvirus MP10 5560]AXB22566.1 replication initiation protein [Alces alces faeces associated microvirus MP10 5560]